MISPRFSDDFLIQHPRIDGDTMTIRPSALRGWFICYWEDIPLLARTSKIECYHALFAIWQGKNVELYPSPESIAPLILPEFMKTQDN